MVVVMPMWYVRLVVMMMVVMMLLLWLVMMMMDGYHLLVVIVVYELRDVHFHVSTGKEYPIVNHIFFINNHNLIN